MDDTPRADTDTDTHPDVSGRRERRLPSVGAIGPGGSGHDGEGRDTPDREVEADGDGDVDTDAGGGAGDGYVPL